MAFTQSDTNTKADAYLHNAEADLCDLLEEMVALKTANPPGENYLECARFLEEKLQELGVETELHRVPDDYLAPALPYYAEYPRYCLIGRKDHAAAETVHFNAHYDVVPAGDGWTSPPYEPEIRNGWMYGRGTSDMKGSIASLLFALKALRETGTAPKLNIEISLVPDEESNSLLGTGWVVQEGLVKADYAVVCEGGWEKVIGCGHNGVLWMEVIVRGKSAHASRPYLGVNAFEKAAVVVTELERYKAGIAKHVFTAPGGEKFTPPLTIGGEVRSSHGMKINTIPDSISFTLDRRILPDENLEQAEQDLRDFLDSVAKSVPDLELEVRKISSRLPSMVPEENPLPQEFVKTVRHYHPRAGVGMTQGFTDMAFFQNDAGIPTVGYGVGGKNIHGVDECVEVADLVSTAQIYARFLADWQIETKGIGE